MSNDAARVLIADDAYINRMILSSLLASYGVEADEAENGRECLALCRENSYDMIFLDQKMPEQDGTDTLIQLKELFQETGRDVPVICHTAEDSPGLAESYRAAGYADVLGKPAQPKLLTALLATYLPEGSWSYHTDPAEAAAQLENELTSLPEWLKDCKELDPKTGITHCQTAKDYLDALTVFIRSISGKAEEIKLSLEKEDWKQFTLHVHSLKSISRLVGANALHDLAAALETAGEQTDTDRIRQDTPGLLEQCLAFSDLLTHIPQEDENSGNSDAPDGLEGLIGLGNPNTETRTSGYVRNSVIFIEGDDGFIPNAIVNKLRTADFEVVCLPDNADTISEHKDDAEILLYYLPKAVEQALRTTPSLLNLCRTEHKTLCLVGESFSVKKMRTQEYIEQVHAIYQRPFDLDELVADMKTLSASHDEFYRLKTVLVVDDDPSFQKVISMWLSEDYHVVGVSSGAEALTYLERTRPDLILLDYQMPELDGYQVLEQIRQNPMTAQVPIIFLTGQNDKDQVMRILHQKPDGYLLKTASKEDLLATLNRFFVNSILDRKRS